ncbi:MAG: hypothetical protein KDJ52_00200 [Anaerolineae bacterium]|nr:hypothetical protein [Anaerolineae bacterium]
MPSLISNLSDLTNDAIKSFQEATKDQQAQDINKLETMNKAITQSTGLVWYDLQAPAKNLIPVITPIRNVVPRVSGNGGTATNWKAVTAINTNSLRSFVPEGKRNGAVATTVEDKSASYKSEGLEDTVTFEAELAGQNLENVRATTAQRLLWAVMIEEELNLLGANGSVALGTPTAPTVTVQDGDGSIADATYNVIVVALTLHGYLASSLTSGVVGQVSVSTVDGQSFNYGGGSSNKSSATSTGAISNGDDSAISASTPVIAGAVAYAWYVGTAGNEKLEAITTINSVKLTSLAGTGQAASAITADYSKNTLGYDGLLYQAWATGSNAYIKNMATGTPGTGTTLTSDGTGGIVELNDLFRHMWDVYRLSPSKIYVNSQESDNITNKVLSASAARLNFVTGNDVNGGIRIKSLLNRFAMGGSVQVPIEIHPYVPAGTIKVLTERLPYPIANIPNVFEKRMRRDYYQMEWPLRTRQYETGVYCDGVLAHYFPPSMGIITNVANG